MVALRHSAGFDFASFRRLLAAVGVLAAVFAVSALSAQAQGNRPQGQQPAQQPEPEEEEIDEIALTAKHIDSFIATQKEINPITSRLQADAQPNQEQMTQMENIAKKNGFKDFNEFGDVAANIGMIYGGIDPQNKKYDPQGMIQKEIAAVNADTKIPAAQKRQIVQDLRQAASAIPKLKYPGNVDLVVQNYDRLKPAMEQQ
jgi:hypothetical protein